MAIFKCPKITTAQRLDLILQEAEIVYDFEQKRYYGGDNFRLGGFPLGDGATPKIELRVITQDEVDQKFITLEGVVSQPDLTKFHFINGTTQLIGIDYSIVGVGVISWEALGLDGFIESGDVVRIEYF
jgi:hypothetical protein